MLFTLPALKRGIVNGQLGTITSIGVLGRSLNVRLDDGRRVTVPALGPFPLGADRYRHKTGPDAGKYGLKHGYAITTHRAQGSTFDRAFVLLGGGMQDRELTYVQVTRAKEATFLYTDQETAGYRNQRLISQMSRETAPALASTQMNSEPQPAQQPAPAR